MPNLATRHPLTLSHATFPPSPSHPSPSCAVLRQGRLFVCVTARARLCLCICLSVCLPACLPVLQPRTHLGRCGVVKVVIIKHPLAGSIPLFLQLSYHAVDPYRQEDTISLNPKP